MWKGCFIVHLFLNALKCASTVLECSCCRIHRYVAAPLTSNLTRFRRASDWEASAGQNEAFSLLTSRSGYFFSWSKIFSFPFNKHAFSYNTVFSSFFEEKSNVVKLGYRLAEKLESGGTVKICPREDLESPRKFMVGGGLWYRSRLISGHTRNLPSLRGGGGEGQGEHGRTQYCIWR